MLQINKRAPLASQEAPKVIAPLIEAFQSSLRIVRRQLPIVLVIIACCLALAILYLATTAPKFTAVGSMVIDTRKVQLLQQQSVLGDAQIDASTVQTQVEMLKSDNVALAVIRKLRLIDDAEFVPPPDEKSFLSFLFPAAPAKPLSESAREEIALSAFQDRLTVSREGLTYVIDVGFTSLNADKSALIVNTLVDAFVNDQMDAKYQAARRAGVWLAERIKELRSQAAAAERAVVDFKKKNNIVDTGPTGGGAGNNRLINDQQLSELNTQLILARAATAEAKARLDRITEVMSQDVPDASLADALKSEVIIKLRQQYLDLSQREAIFSQRYGANHLATVNLRTQMQEIRHSIADEMRKIAESYKSDYEIARTREQNLKDSLANAVTVSQSSGQAQIQLRELTSNAETSRTLYDNFLQRYMEAVQQQDAIPISETRMISPALPPLKKSGPKTVATILLALAAGGALSFGFAYLREASDGVFRTSDQIEDTLRVNCLAMAPALKFSAPRADGEMRSEPIDKRPASQLDFLRNVVDAPFSRYAEAVRSVKIAADLNGALKSHKVIGLTSTLPNEGKSTLAANLAHLIADAGGNVILVDADLRSPSLSRWIAPDAPGLIDVVIGNISLESAVITVAPSRLQFLAAGATSKLPHTNEILASAAMKNLIDNLRAKYDYIIVDLSPVAPIVDVRTTGHVIDAYVYVIEWGQTKIDVVERGLSEAQGVYDRLLGVVLNKVDMSAQSRYERYHGNHYYRKYYSKYGYLE